MMTGAAAASDDSVPRPRRARCMPAADSSSSSSGGSSEGCGSQCSSGSCCSSSGRLRDSEAGCTVSALCQREWHHCVTRDGWQLAILHVRDPAAQQAGCGRQRPQHPVLMLPGLASSGEHTFDLLPEHSLVDALAARGFHVWVADLRGNGRSQKPRLLDSSTWWTVDTHLHQDLPAVLTYVLAASGAQQLHYIGHSMGGMLAVGLLSQQHALARALRSVTLLASGCFAQGSWHDVVSPLIQAITRFGFPAGAATALIGALSGTLAALLPLEALFYCPSNTPPAAARKLMGSCFHFIPAGVIRQFISSINSRHGLAAADGSFLYCNPQTLALARVPVQALSGSRDLFCPPDGARRTLELFGSPHKRFVCLGPAHGTAQRHYGHFDVVCGRDAAAEVYPLVYSWLQRHDG